MIQLTRLNHIPLILNSDLIEHIEVTPDTVIALTTGQRFLVLETADEVVEKVIAFRKTILTTAGCPLAHPDAGTAGERQRLGQGLKANGG